MHYLLCTTYYVLLTNYGNVTMHLMLATADVCGENAVTILQAGFCLFYNAVLRDIFELAIGTRPQHAIYPGE